MVLKNIHCGFSPTAILYNRRLQEFHHFPRKPKHEDVGQTFFVSFLPIPPVPRHQPLRSGQPSLPTVPTGPSFTPAPARPCPAPSPGGTCSPGSRLSSPWASWRQPGVLLPHRARPAWATCQQRGAHHFLLQSPHIPAITPWRLPSPCGHSIHPPTASDRAPRRAVALRRILGCTVQYRFARAVCTSSGAISRAWCAHPSSTSILEGAPLVFRPLSVAAFSPQVCSHLGTRVLLSLLRQPQGGGRGEQRVSQGPWILLNCSAADSPCEHGAWTRHFPV